MDGFYHVIWGWFGMSCLLSVVVVFLGFVIFLFGATEERRNTQLAFLWEAWEAKPEKERQWHNRPDYCHKNLTRPWFMEA